MKSRGINIDNTIHAKKVLSSTSYYALMNGYKDTCIMPRKDIFLKGLTFYELYILHCVDSSLNIILFKYILHIERAFKTKLSYLISANYGVYTDYNLSRPTDINDYRCTKHYSNSTNLRTSVLSSLANDINTAHNYTSTRFYRDNKNHIPPWILVNDITFYRTMSWYKILKSPDKDVICEGFLKGYSSSLIAKKTFFSIALKLLRKYRNNIAHGKRSFTAHIDVKLPKLEFLNLLPSDVLSHAEYDKGLGANDLFAVLLTLIILLDDPLLIRTFYTDLETWFKSYSGASFAEKSVYEVMSLPPDIKDRIEKAMLAKQTSL